MLIRGAVLSGRYEVLEQIGSGGMAIVFRGKDQTLDRFVTIKVLRDEFVGDEDFIGRFRSEALAAARLSHPNIVRVYDVGVENGNYFIVMEYIHGDTLKKAIEQKAPFDTNSTINVAIQIAAALSQAHKNHIVHRDIKPQNILVGTDGIIKVTDFGIARAATSATMSMSANAAGSVHYFSPEQARGGYVDEKSDIYSLGIAMYEMLTGKLPFEGDNSVAIAMKHITEELPDIRQYNAKASKSLEGIIKMATRKKADERYSNIDLMLEDLMRAKMENGGQTVISESVPGASAAVAATIANVPVNKTTPENENRELSYISGGPRRARQMAKQSQVPLPEVTRGQGEQNGKSRAEGLPESGVGFDKYSKKLKISNDDEYENEYEDVEPLKRSQPPQKTGKVKRSPRQDADYNNERDKKKERMVIFAAVCTALLIITGISAFGFSMLTGTGGLFGEKEKATVEVPSFEGIDFNKASEAAKALGFTLLQEGKDYSNKHDEGLIISQKVAQGTKVEEGAEVGVTVSLGYASEIMPNLIGKTEKDALKAIDDLVGVSAQVTYETDKTDTVGKVISQSPDNGAKVTAQSRIRIVVSKGEDDSMVKVPKVEGMTESQAKKELERVGLKLGNVTSAESETAAEGVIITQTVSAGKEVAPESVVGIVISSGPPKEEEKTPEEEPEEKPVDKPEDKPEEKPEEKPTTPTTGTKMFSIDAPSSSGDSVHVKLVTIGADGTTKTVIDEVKTIDTFPYVTSITDSGSATVQCYIDGVQQWSNEVNFTEG